MVFKIHLSKRAYKELEKLPISDRKRILKRIGELSTTPFPYGYRKLRGAKDAYRLRAGDYRILYKIIRRDKVILVFRIAHRRKAYLNKMKVNPG